MTKRCIAPMISKFIRDRWSGDDETVSTNSALKQAWLLEQEWGEVWDGVEMIAKDANGIKQIAGSSYDVRRYVNAETTRNLSLSRSWDTCQ